MGQNSEPPPLFVDLDRTLVRTDTLVECVLAIINRPLRLGSGLLALRYGKAAMKQKIAAAAELASELLPYNEELLSLLRDEAAAGRSLILATGADRNVAAGVADHLCIFDAVLASNGQINLTAGAKLDAIRGVISDRPFAYAGNGRQDLAIWREAESAILVDAPKSVRRVASETTRIERSFTSRTSWSRALLQAIRPYQWSKNLLVFVPILTARAIDDVAAWGAAVLMFLAFSAVASGMYLINDLRDLAADRRHPRKRHRPFASGALPLHIGLIAIPVLLLCGFSLAAASTLPALLIYVVASAGYSLYLKSWPLIDIFLLAALYGLRLFGGGVATGYRVSLWLLAFSSFLFLSLAIVKRVSELMALATQDERIVGRGYRPSDAGILQLMGVASSFVASMVLALYVQSDINAGAASDATLVWALVPLTLFWQCRIWLSTARGHIHDDPIIFAARDWISWLVAICAVAALLLGNQINL